MAKYIKVGKITQNQTKDGKSYTKFIMSKEFLDNAGELTSKAYEMQNGDRSFYMFKPQSENAPDWLLYDVLVKDESAE